MDIAIKPYRMYNIRAVKALFKEIKRTKNHLEFLNTIK